jgi:ribosome-binding factor A
MKPFSRNDRVGGQIQKILAELLRKQISDPRLAHVTITGVEVSADLRIAKVYYSASAAGVPAGEILEGFLHAQGFIKRELAQQLRLRYMPDLKFFFDESIDYGARIEQLLKAAKQHDETDP